MDEQEYTGPRCRICGAPVSGEGRRCRPCAQRERSAQAGIAIDAELFRMQAEDGMTLRQIGERVGISHERVRARINRHRWRLTRALAASLPREGAQT